MRIVLGRKAGEKIIIGNDVEVSVAGVDRGQFRVVVVAPPDVKVDRAEVRAAKLKKAADLAKALGENR